MKVPTLSPRQPSGAVAPTGMKLPTLSPSQPSGAVAPTGMKLPTLSPSQPSGAVAPTGMKLPTLRNTQRSGPGDVMRWKIPKLTHSPAAARVQPATSIGSLPPEMLLEVFGYLSPATNICVIARVCRQWWNLHTASWLYTRLQFSGDSPTTAAAVKLLKLATHLRTLILIQRSDGNALLKMVGKCNTRIKSLTLIKCRGDDDRMDISGVHVNRILRTCSGIQEIRLKQTWTNSKVFYERLGGQLTALKDIQLGASTYITGNVLTSIATNCEHLEHLRLFHSTDAKTRSKITAESVTTLCALRKNSLRTLKINALNINNEAMRSIAACDQLKTLHLRQLHNVNDVGIQRLAALQNIRTLLISGANSISAGAWNILFQSDSLKTLRKVSLERCLHVNDAAVTTMGQKLQNLRAIWLIGCTGVSEEGRATLHTVIHQSCKVFIVR